MTIHKMKFGLVVLMSVLFVSMGCLALTQKAQIPEDALSGLDVNSVKSLGYFQLSDWASNVPASAHFVMFEGRSLDAGEMEVRLYYEDGEQTFYLGALSDQFGIPELKTIFVDLGEERSIVGFVDPSVPGKLLYAHFEPDAVNTLYAQKESTIESNLFIVPITGDDIYLWDYVTMAAIQTQASLDRGFDGLGSYYEVEAAFDPALDVSGYYIHIPVQQP